MCFPTTPPSPQQDVEVPKKRWGAGLFSPLQIVKALRDLQLNKSIRSNGREIRQKVRRVRRWVFNFTFAKVFVPLVLIGFVLLLHPHKEIQVGVTGGIVIFSFVFFITTQEDKSCLNKSTLAAKKTSQALDFVHQPLSLSLHLYSLLPLNLISHLWGLLADKELPQPLGNFSVWLFAVASGCRRDEAEFDDLSSYKTVSQFFTRKLKPGLRPICSDSHLVSPADGTITYSGVLEGIYLQQVKGVQYSLWAFLGRLDNIQKSQDISSAHTFESLQDTEDEKILTANCLPYDSIYTSDKEENQQEFCQELSVADGSTTPQTNHSSIAAVNKQFLNSSPGCDQLLSLKTNRLYQSVVYLSPSDYHRFHSPTDWTVSRRRHFPGKLYSVAPTLVKRIPGLFHTNERVAFFGTWSYGFFAMVAVGATNVGSMKVNFDEELNTNSNDGCKKLSEKVYEAPIEIKKGDEFGYFNFGSTIVLIYEAPYEIKLGNEHMKRVKMGESLWMLD